MKATYNAADFLARLFGSAMPAEISVAESSDAPRPVAESRNLPNEPGPLVDHFSAAPAADTKHVARSRRPNPTSGGDWPADVAAMADFALLLSVDDLPAAPFDFGPAETVVDAAKFLYWLRADVRRGPSGPRAMYGALQSDLRRLSQCVGLDSQ
ncbi:MAG: hypothetical protein O3C40_31685 [Planctomycetota bacterium]|nr:hypothetical protein [Planctomycetota bacterium]